MQTKFSELNKLKNAAKILENTRVGVEEKITALVDPTVVILKRKLHVENEECTKKLKNLISNISHSMDCITQQVDNNNADISIDLGCLKKSMISLQHDISTGRFELQSQISCLQEEESALNEDLKVYETYLKECAFDEINMGVNKKNTIVDCKKGSKTEEVRKSFVWNRENQLKYLKAKKTYDDFDQMCKVLTALITGITKEDICEYEKSKQEQREVILNDEMKNKESSAEGAKAHKSNKKKETQDQKTKEKLAAWREEKKDKAIMEQHLKQLMDIKKMNEELYRRLKNEQAKERIRQWKKEKIDLALVIDQKQLEDNEISAEARKIRANSLIKEYRKQDSEIAKRKLQRKSEGANLKPPRTPKCYAKRDPNRLHRATEQWTARTREDLWQSEKALGTIQFFNKKVPTWRQAS